MHSISMNKQTIKTLSFCYSLLLAIGQFQLKLFYCGKGRQNFASNVTLYPCERSRQNHLDMRTGNLSNMHSISMNKQTIKTLFSGTAFYEASSSSSYFTVEKAAKTLHRMSPCTPVSVPTKITCCDRSGSNFARPKLQGMLYHITIFSRIWIIYSSF